MISLIFDTETTNKYQFKLPADHLSQPDVIQLAMILEEDEEIIARAAVLVKPAWEFRISPDALAVHGISHEKLENFGIRSVGAMALFIDMLRNADTIVAHNLEFDLGLMTTLAARLDQHVGGNGGRAELFLNLVASKQRFCTMQTATPFCKLPGLYSGYKWPKLGEALHILCDYELEGAHDALADAMGCRQLYHYLWKELTKTAIDEG